MKTVHIGTGAPYDALIGAGLLKGAGERLRALHAPCRVGIVTDSNVAPLYVKPLSEALLQAGFEPVSIVIPAGEAHKTLQTYGEIQSFMVEKGLTRADLFCALGGGVVGDLTGFAAATYQRGVPFVQLPTTLLCAVDASVGGKTAVDLPEGKNLVGAFHQPLCVLCDTDTFQSLDEARWADGAAEALKHGLIADRALFERMKGGAWRADIEAVVARNIEIKRAFVEGDERDQGKRKLLNFGHTLGHAAELQSGFALSHGQAVAIGIVLEARAAHRMGFGADVAKEIIGAAQNNGLPVACPCGAEALMKAVLRDKKREGDAIEVGYLKEIGQGALKKLSIENLLRFTALAMEG